MVMFAPVAVSDVTIGLPVMMLRSKPFAMMATLVILLESLALFWNQKKEAKLMVPRIANMDITTISSTRVNAFFARKL